MKNMQKLFSDNKENDNDEYSYNLKLPSHVSNNKVLLHSCCAPCAGDLMKRMKASGIELTIFFYNPNIHPKKEYEIRKEENIRYAKELDIEFIDADYDVQNWFSRAKGLEKEPERGVRCTKCFDMRFERTAFTLMKMVLKFLPHHLAFHAGKIWIKSMIAELDLLKIIKV